MDNVSIYSKFLEVLLFWSVILALSVTAISNTWAVMPFIVWFLLKFALELKVAWTENRLK